MTERPAIRVLIVVVVICGFICTTPLLAQQDDNTTRSAVVPNPMGIHTWFIIAAAGAFLAWSISYSLQLQKEALKRRSSREGLLWRKNKYLDEIADLEGRKQAGTLSQSSYRRRFNNTRIRLARVLAEIEQSRESGGQA